MALGQAPQIFKVSEQGDLFELDPTKVDKFKLNLVLDIPRYVRPGEKFKARAPTDQEMILTVPKSALPGDQLLLMPSGNGSYKISKLLSGRHRVGKTVQPGDNGTAPFVLDVPPTKRIGEYIVTKVRGQDFKIKVPKAYQKGDQLLIGIKDDGSWGILKVLGGQARLGIKGTQTVVQQAAGEPVGPFVVDIPWDKPVGEYIDVRIEKTDFKIRVPKTALKGDQLLIGKKEDGNWGTLKVLGGKARHGPKGEQSNAEQQAANTAWLREQEALNKPGALWTVAKGLGVVGCGLLAGLGATALISAGARVDAKGPGGPRLEIEDMSDDSDDSDDSDSDAQALEDGEAEEAEEVD